MWYLFTAQSRFFFGSKFLEMMTFSGLKFCEMTFFYDNPLLRKYLLVNIFSRCMKSGGGIQQALEKNSIADSYFYAIKTNRIIPNDY